MDFRSPEFGGSSLCLPELRSDLANVLFPEIECDCEDSVQTEKRPVSCDQGFERSIVKISEGEWKSLAETEKKYSVIGRFGRNRPAMELIRADLRMRLRIGGEIQIGSLNARSVLIRFSSEEDCKKALMRNRMTVAGAGVWLSRWTPEWRPWRDAPIVPVWIQFPNIPLHLFNIRIMERICGSIGSFLFLDVPTERRSRPSVARARVEVDLRRPLPNRIWIEIGNAGNGFWQRINVEEVPRFCPNCSQYGHLVSNCRRMGRPAGVIGCEEEGEVGGEPGIENRGENDHVNPGIEQDEAETPAVVLKRDECIQTVCTNVCMKDGELIAPICDQNAQEAGGNVSVENGLVTPSTEQGLEELEGKGISAEESIDKMVREDVNDGKIEVAVERRKERGLQKQNEGCNVESSSSKEECVTPKRKKSGGMTNEDFFVQFATAMEAIVKGSFERKGSRGKESESSAQVSGKDVSKGSAKGEVRVFKNTMDWVKVVEEFRKNDKVLDQKVKEALKEVNAYLWTVYDKEKEEYFEEGRNRAMKAAAIFLVKVKHCPSWGSEDGLLGRYLKSNIDSVGARICHWAVTLDL